MNAVCPTDAFVGISCRAASSMVLSVQCLPLMLFLSLSERCWLCLCLCKLVMSPFKAVGCPFLLPQYNPFMIVCDEPFILWVLSLLRPCHPDHRRRVCRVGDCPSLHGSMCSCFSSFNVLGFCPILGVAPVYKLFLVCFEVVSGCAIPLSQTGVTIEYYLSGRVAVGSNSFP